MLVLLTVAYFFFMTTEAALVDTSSCVSEIIEMHSDVLVDFLVLLARVVDAVPPSSSLEGLSVITVLVGETTSAGAVIRSWRGGSASMKVSDPGGSR